MKRFVEGVDRGQSTLFPDRLEDWIGEDNPVRVIDVFVDELDLGGLGFDRVAPRATGRPGYHPSVLLKLYIYGYLNRVQSSRRLEPFAEASVAIDGSKFKAVNTRDKNFTRAKMKRRMEQVEESVERYLHQLDSADRQEPSLVSGGDKLCH